MSEAAKRIYVYPEFTHKVTTQGKEDVEYVRGDIVEEMRDKLIIASQVFRAYQAHHEAKGDMDKAERNSGYAEQMEAALNLLEEE